MSLVQPSRPPAADSQAPGGDPSRREVAETSELVLHLIHATYAARDLGAGDRAHERGPTELSPHAIRAAIHLHQHGRRTIGELARGLEVSYGWASRIARELEDAALVTRETDPSDRRVVRVSLTADAIRDVEGTYRWHGEAIRLALEPLTAEEREAVRAFLRRASAGLAKTRKDGTG